MQDKTKPFCLLFTGHRIDAPGREQPRFPASAEWRAKRMIRQAIEKILARLDGIPLTGIAGGASGGDILFHELCREAKVPTTVYLALPAEEYAARSVDDAGPEWTRRYWQLLERLPAKVLADNAPRAFAKLGVWQRCNLWMLEAALHEGNAGVALIALWDMHEADGPGGTRDMVERARQNGAEIDILNARQLLQDNRKK